MKESWKTEVKENKKKENKKKNPDSRDPPTRGEYAIQTQHGQEN
jgi:hypothetical protein